MSARGLTVVGLVAAAAMAGAQEPEWVRWLGPSQNGSIAGASLSGKPGVTLRKAWSRPVEGGQSGVVVSGGRAFTLASFEDADHAVALDVATGRELWRRKLDALNPNANQGPSSTPAAHGGRLYALSTACVLRALDQANGTAAWEVDLKARFQANPRQGCTSSPFVEEGRLILLPANREEHRAAALDPGSGETLWTAKGVGRIPYSSPVAARLGGVAQLIVNDLHDVADGGRPRSGLAGLRATDGGVLWNAVLENHLSFETPLVLPRD